MMKITNSPQIQFDISIPSITNKMFDDTELKKINDYCSNLELAKSLVVKRNTGDGYFNLNTSGNDEARICNSNIFGLDENNSWFFDKINSAVDFFNQQVFGFDLYGYETMQYAEYDIGGKFDLHMDLVYGNKTIELAMTRKLSISILLNDDFEGGDFEMLTSGLPNLISLKAGDFVMFPSYLLHRITPVTKGVRKSLVVWVVGPKFK